MLACRPIQTGGAWLTTNVDDGVRHAPMSAMKRQQFLSEASRILGESIDYEATLKSIARLAVPDIADWCVVDLVQDDGSMARVAIEHKDGARHQLAAELKDHFPPIMNAPAGPGHVLRTCRTDYQANVPQSFIDAAASEPERLRLLRRLGLHAYICAPLIARGRFLGTITLFTGGGRAFGSDDVAMAEELARRSAVAIDNARLYGEAQRAVQARDEMLAIVSHDLRTPLSAIMMAAAVQMASAPPTEEGRRLRERAELCERAAQHMCRLISDLTDIGHIETGRLAIQRSLHSPERLLCEVVETLSPIAMAHGTALRFEAHDDLPSVECDRDRIVQVLSNFVTNAIKVGAPFVTLRADADESSILFAVQDTGPGLPVEDIPHVFDRYWRGQNAKYKGTGLGLPIAKGIIDAHGGCCRVSSEAGVGTTFSFALPLKTNRLREFGADGELRSTLPERGKHHDEYSHVRL